MSAEERTPIMFAVLSLVACVASAAEPLAGKLAAEAARGRYLVTVKDMAAEQFMTLARSPLRPPMPWFSLRDMKDADLKAIYAYLKHLGPAGEPAPAYVPPDKTPAGPFVKFPEPPPK